MEEQKKSLNYKQCQKIHYIRQTTDKNRGLVGKPEGKRSLGRPRRRGEDNIRMDLQEVGCGGMD
jgi:hypothetical protein